MNIQFKRAGRYLKRPLQVRLNDDVGRLWAARFSKFLEFLRESQGVYPRLNQNKENSVPEAELELGRWVRTQRVDAKPNSNRPLSPARRKQLEAANFVLEIDFEKDWALTLAKLVRFLALSNGVYPTARQVKDNSVTESELELGRWVNNQRMAAKEDAGHPLSPERRKQLEDVNFVFEINLDDQWEKHLDRLVEFLRISKGVYPRQKQNKNNSVREAELELGRWVSSQRLASKPNAKYPLTTERRQKLIAFGVCPSNFMPAGANSKYSPR